VFSATEPQAPAESQRDVALLVRTVHVEPEWQFTGHVQPPSGSSAFASPPSTNSSAPKPTGTTKASAPAGIPQKKEGFWSRLKHAFGGG
jgi:hypothetical protein